MKLIIKDNYVREVEDFWFDETDGNILRSMELFNDIFRAAGVKVVEAEDQATWPTNLMPIKIKRVQSQILYYNTLKAMG